MSKHVTAALNVMQVVAGRPDPTEPLAVGTIARTLRMTLSRASRLCAELETLDLFERGDAYGTYRLGAGAIALSGRAAEPLALAVRFALTLAAQQTGETALLAAPTADGLRVVSAVESIWTLHSPAEVGELIDDESSAALHAARRASADDRPEARLTESVIGFRVEVAAPILAPTGECIAVLAVRLPVNRSELTGPRARRAVLAATRSVETRLADWLAAPVSRPAGVEDATLSALEATVGILKHLSGGQDSVAGTARATGLRPDRAQRLVDSCRTAGFVIDGDERGGLQLGWMVHGWFRAAAAPTIVRLGTGLVEQTANRTLTCGFVTMLKSMRSFTIVEELEMAGEGLLMASWLGRAHPIIGSDGGPTLVMDFTVDQLRLLFPARHTPQEFRLFLDRVRQVVRDGVLSMEAFEDAGIISISAPIRDSSGTVMAAACLVGTTDYMRDNVDAFEEAARQLAAELSGLLQHPADPVPTPLRRLAEK
jgi:DNA-binding IclR family transcriptional regulator